MRPEYATGSYCLTCLYFWERLKWAIQAVAGSG